MSITHQILEEPLLEFGNGGRHIDPRLGLYQHGPLQPMPGDLVSIGVIGTAETVEGFERWMERLGSAIPGKSEKQPNLFPPFPGLGNDNPFQCRFEVSPTTRRTLPAPCLHETLGISLPFVNIAKLCMKRPTCLQIRPLRCWKALTALM